MALCLDELVVCGELFNTRWYSVHGWLQLKGHESPLMLQLTGNCAPELAGWHIRFESREAAADEGSPANEELDEAQRRDYKRLKIAWQQIGPTGPMTAIGLSPAGDRGPVEDAGSSETSQDSARAASTPRLHLEWHSQNGHVTLDLIDPLVEFVDFTEIKWGVRNRRAPAESGDVSDDPLDPSSPAADLDELGLEGDSLIGDGLEFDDELNEDSDLFLEEPDDGDDDSEDWRSDEDDEDDDDPYGLFPDDLEDRLDPEPAPAPWEPDADEDTAEAIREMELMDDLIENSPGEPVGEIFDRPVRLPLPDDIDDGQAELALKSLLAEMALFGIALDICEHFTPRDAYRLLVEEICKEERAYPELRQTQWVQQFMTSEFCPTCEAEFDREYEDREQKRRESGEEDPSDDSDDDKDIPF